MAFGQTTAKTLGAAGRSRSNMGIQADDGEDPRPDIQPEVDLCSQTIKEFVTNPFFEAFIFSTIAMNVILIAVIGAEPEPGSLDESIIFWTILVVTPVYTVEMVLKMWGFGLWRDQDSYLMDNWCRFDLFVVLAAWVDVGMMFSEAFSGEDANATNLMVMRIIRTCRILRIFRGSLQFESSRVMVFVMLKTVVNCKWVLCILAGFILCVVTLGLNWFGSEMRYKCVKVDRLFDASGEVFSLSEGDKQLLEQGKAWDEVTALPYNLQVPAQFCRHQTRPGPKTWGNRCAEEEGMMCVFIDEAPFEGLMGFEDFASAASTVIFIILQQEFDAVALGTMQATVRVSGAFFAAIMVFGGFFLLEYVTAILCITHSEAKTLNPEYSDYRMPTDQILLQIELMEGDGKDRHTPTIMSLSPGQPAGSKDAREDNPSTESSEGGQIPTPGKISATMADIRPPKDEGILHHVWLFRKRVRDWTRRQPKTKDVCSMPLLTWYLDVNVEAFERIQQRVAETAGHSSKVAQLCKTSLDMTSYVVAAAIMYPSPPSEMYGARGWNGSSTSGVLAHWEWGVTALSVLEIAFHFRASADRIQTRQDGYEMTTGQASERLSWMIWSLFAFDMILKLVAFKGPQYYMHSTLNQVDTVATTIQLIGMVTWKHPNLSGLRVMRWISVLALARNVTNFHDFLEKAFGSLTEPIIATCWIFLFLTFIAVFGEQIFAGADYTDFPRPYFSTFYQSLVSVVELSTNDSLTNMIRQGKTVGIYTIVFLILTVFIVNLLLLRLMIPFMLQKCDESEIFKIRYQLFFGRVQRDDCLIWTHQHQHVKLLAFFKDFDSIYQGKEKTSKQLESVKIIDDKPFDTSVPQYGEQDKEMKTNRAREQGQVTTHASCENANTIANAVDAWNRWGYLAYGDHGHLAKQTSEKNGLMRCIKLAFNRIVSHKFYEPFMSLIVIATCFLFGARHIPNAKYYVQVELEKSLQSIMLLVFQMELVLKVWMTYGKSVDKTPYHKDPWHVADVLALFGMWWTAVHPDIPSNRGLSNLRFFHLIRVMRALAVIPDIELAYERLEAVKLDVLYAFFLIFCLIIAFATLAMPTFGGLFSACNDEVVDRIECSGLSYKIAGNLENEFYILHTRVWEAPTENFDSVTQSLGTSFALFLNTGWGPVIHRAMSITSAGIQPLQYGSGVMGLAFVAYQVLAMILRQLLVVMTISSLKMSSGSGLQTDDQKTWSATLRMCESKCAAYRSKGSTRGKGLSAAIALKRQPTFRILVEITIVVNIVTMLFVSYGASRTREDIMQYINFACLLVYLVEMLTILLAELHLYFLSAWNVFDMVINIITMLDLYFWFTNVDGAEPSIEIMSLRSARVLRLIKLAGRHPNISLLLNFSAKAIKSCIGCYLLWGFLMLLFAIPANQMFADIRQSSRVDPVTYSNFNDFGLSVLYLFRIAVQNNFVYEAHELDIQEPYCTVRNHTLMAIGQDGWNKESSSDCGPDDVSIWIFFALFSTLSRLVIVPFIAGCVVFSFFETMDALRSVVTTEDISKFEDCWQSFDPMKTGYISIWKVPALMERMRSSLNPLWFDKGQYPEKHEQMTCMLQDEMNKIRADLKEQVDSSLLFRMKHESDPGLQPGQLRYDSLLKTLTAIKWFSLALSTPPTEQFHKMDKICSETFTCTQDLVIGAIFAKMKLAKRKADTLVQSQDSTWKHDSQTYDARNGGLQKTGVKRARDELLNASEVVNRPLTVANLEAWHSDEEKWKDPKDFAEMHPRFSVFWLMLSALQPISRDMSLPKEMKRFWRDPPDSVDNWILGHEMRGGDPQYGHNRRLGFDIQEHGSVRTSRSCTTKSLVNESNISLQSGPESAEWRFNQGKWSDVASTASRASSAYEDMNALNEKQPSTSRPAVDKYATISVFFDATWKELVGELGDVDRFMAHLRHDIAFALRIHEAAVDMVAFNKATVCAVLHLLPPVITPATARGSARGLSTDPMKLAQFLQTQAQDAKSEFKMLQPYVRKITVTPPGEEDILTSITKVGEGIGGVNDMLKDDYSRPPNFFGLLGEVSRGLFR